MLETVHIHYIWNSSPLYPLYFAILALKAHSNAQDNHNQQSERPLAFVKKNLRDAMKYLKAIYVFSFLYKLYALSILQKH